MLVVFEGAQADRHGAVLLGEAHLLHGFAKGHRRHDAGPAQAVFPLLPHVGHPAVP